MARGRRVLPGEMNIPLPRGAIRTLKLCENWAFEDEELFAVTIYTTLSTTRFVGTEAEAEVVLHWAKYWHSVAATAGYTEIPSRQSARGLAKMVRLLSDALPTRQRTQDGEKEYYRKMLAVVATTRISP